MRDSVVTRWVWPQSHLRCRLTMASRLSARGRWGTSTGITLTWPSNAQGSTLPPATFREREIDQIGPIARRQSTSSDRLTSTLRRIHASLTRCSLRRTGSARLATVPPNPATRARASSAIRPQQGSRITGDTLGFEGWIICRGGSRHATALHCPVATRGARPWQLRFMAPLKDQVLPR
jgi:hypothetical protein